MCSSFRSIVSQQISTAVNAKERYSVSVEDRVMVGYFLANQAMGLLPRKTHSPLVDFQSAGSPAQSTSEKAISLRQP